MKRKKGRVRALTCAVVAVSGIPGIVSSQVTEGVEQAGKQTEAVEPSQAEATAPEPEPAVDTAAIPAGGNPLDRDPFAIGGGRNGDGDLRFIRQAGASLPPLRLRGIVNGQDGARVGLLEVGSEGVYMVREGDTISLRTGGASSNAVINVVKINQLTLVIESGTLGEVIIVR